MYWTIITLRTYLSMTYINLDIRILHTLMYQVDLCYTDTGIVSKVSVELTTMSKGVTDSSGCARHRSVYVILTRSQLKIFSTFSNCLYVNVRLFLTTRTTSTWQSNPLGCPSQDKWQSNRHDKLPTHPQMMMEKTWIDWIQHSKDHNIYYTVMRLLVKQEVTVSVLLMSVWRTRLVRWKDKN